MNKHQYIQRPSFVLLALLIFLIISCRQQQGFQLLSSEQTGITFNNFIPDDPNINILNTEYLYNGSGVGVADFNADGQLDVFFAGNLVNNALYLNKGAFKFEDVTEKAGVLGKGKWTNGVSIVDINNDHLPDIYLSISALNAVSQPKNQLFVNQGNNEQNIPMFKEMASAYGIASTKHARHAAFLDYDRDGDLDLFVINNIIDRQEPTVFRRKVIDGTSPSTDQLFRNNGDQTFTEISKEAGISYEGYSLGIAIGDINGDGWADVYIANDYITNDVLYINQRDGTFKNEIGERTEVQSKFSMGASFADFNNDNNLDLFVVDMMSATNDRLKRHVKGSNYNNRKNAQRYKYQEQIARNVLQQNDGSGHFGEVGMYAGVFASDWSWSPLTADFNNDGFQDIYVTNGFPKDITELDWVDYRAGANMAMNRTQIFEKLVIEKVPNCLFLNKGGMQFEEQAKNWQIDIPSFSNGAVYADFDQNGSLDIVVNNINESAFVLKNDRQDKGNFLQIQFPIESRYSSAIGAKVGVFVGDQSYYQEYHLNKSYQSSVAPFLHFGLGNAELIDSIVVEYPTWDKVVFTNITTNQLFEVIKKSPPEKVDILSDQPYVNWASPTSPTSFEIANGSLQMKSQRQNDFFYQQTLPFAYSTLGPVMAMVDINNDYKEELIVIDSHDEVVYWINPELETIDTLPNLVRKGVNGLLVVDMNGDGNQDMVLTYGGYSIDKSTTTSSLEILLNLGDRQFKKQVFNTHNSFSVIRGNDIDKDGDIDLFLGGTTYRNHFPLADESYLFINETTGAIGNQLDKSELRPLGNLGIVMDALWTDIDGDESRDLLIASHLQPIQVLTFQENELTTNSQLIIQSNAIGFWNSIHPIDYENDGDVDYVLSNLGINTPLTSGESTIEIAYRDLDNNGSIDGFIGFQFNGIKTPVPFEFRNEVISQVPLLKKQFTNYQTFAEITFDDFIHSKNKEPYTTITVQETRHQLLLNKEGDFQLIPLPRTTQMSPMYGMASSSFNEDNLQDLIGTTNLKDTREVWGTYAALTGVFLSNSKDSLPFDFLRNMPKIKGESRSIVSTLQNGQLVHWISRIDQPFMKLSTTCETCFFYTAQEGEEYALLTFKDGTKRKEEFYIGSGFRSQGKAGFWVSNINAVQRIEIKTRTGFRELGNI